RSPRRGGELAEEPGRERGLRGLDPPGARSHDRPYRSGRRQWLVRAGPQERADRHRDHDCLGRQSRPDPRPRAGPEYRRRLPPPAVALPAAPAIGGRAKIRVGFMSSDLRNHPVAYFTVPLLLGYDRSRYLVHCYSWCTHAPDPIEQRIAGSVDVFRKDGLISD